MAAVTEELAKALAALIMGLAIAIGEWLGAEVYRALSDGGECDGSGLAPEDWRESEDYQ